MFVIRSTFHLSRFIIAVLAIMVTYILSHVPKEHAPQVLTLFGVDKTLHILAYAIIASLTLRAVKVPLRWKLYIGLFLCIAAFGWFDEYTQQFVRRSCSIYDWTADIIGILMAIAVYRIYTRKFNPDVHRG